MSRPREMRFECGGARMRCLVWDAGAPCGVPPLVLLHGFAQSAESWSEVAPLLARECAVYALDLTGHGRSERPVHPAAYDLDRQAAALLAFLEQVVDASASAPTPAFASAPASAPASPAPADAVAAGQRALPVVLGYSLGGRVALCALAADPRVFACRAAALVLESAGIGPVSPDERAQAADRDARNAARLRAEGLQAFMDAWERLPLFATQRDLPKAVRARLRAGRLANDAESLARTFERAGQHAMPSRATTLAALGDAAAHGLPVLYVAGALDEKYRAIAEGLRAAAPDVSVELVEAAGHNVHLEAPPAFAEAVRAFLGRR